LLERFDTYPRVADALSALTSSTEVTIGTERVGLLSVIGRLEETGLAQLRMRLRALFDTDTQYLAVAPARHQDRSTATELLAEAGRAADQLGVGANYWQTGFGPSNVQLHRVSAALDLGDIPQVIDSAPGVNVDHLPIERQVTHLIDLVRAFSLVARDDDALFSAERKSLGIVRHSVVVREVVRSMYRRAPASAGKKSSPLLALAERCRAVM
jgi:hypothetical protein